MPNLMHQIKSEDNYFLIVWNQKNWKWEDYKVAAELTKQGIPYKEPWSCNTKQIEVGDRVYLLKLGQDPKGILASGIVTSEPYDREHWDEEKRNKGKMCPLVDVSFDVILDYETEELLSQELLKRNFPDQHWSPQGSGIVVKQEYVKALEYIWNAFHRKQRNLEE